MDHDSCWQVDYAAGWILGFVDAVKEDDAEEISEEEIKDILVKWQHSLIGDKRGIQEAGIFYFNAKLSFQGNRIHFKFVEVIRISPGFLSGFDTESEFVGLGIHNRVSTLVQQTGS
ncbi:hypothetical protein Nepgr_012519 [Nepenthes gracilis]|uniref:Uncharacterized protein n=1 Tax=Nepenthes gracilis TaxID=150966 RepID=A0AAD3XN58_NEPGR|nr:hypothetical protein Nepgr_012519 [Nepenthes gracilis]